MTWPGLVWRNLMRRSVRTALTSAGVAIGVALIVALLSIAAGVRRTASDLIHVGRSDFGVFQEGASDLTRSLLPESLDTKLRATPGKGVTHTASNSRACEKHGSSHTYLLLPRHNIRFVKNAG